MTLLVSLFIYILKNPIRIVRKKLKNKKLRLMLRNQTKMEKKSKEEKTMITSRKLSSGQVLKNVDNSLSVAWT